MDTIKTKLIMFKDYLDEGYTITMAAKAAGIPVKSTTYYMNKFKWKAKIQGVRTKDNFNYFDVIDSEKKSYLLGYFLADGYVDKTRVCLNSSIDDLEVLNLFRQEICPDRKIYNFEKASKLVKRKPQVTVRLTSSHMVNVLKDKYSIVQNKTKNKEFFFPFQTIPDALIRHFIRGFFDGDGSISFYKYNKTIFFNFSFIFSSLDFCNQIAEIFEQRFAVKSVIYKIAGKTMDYYTLRFNYSRKRTQIVKQIYSYLYEDSTVFLERKRVKFEHYFKYRANSKS